MTLSHRNTTSTCDTCIHLHRFDNTSGQCRRHSPAIIDEYENARFPLVQTLKDWCGEYSGNIQPLTKDEIRAFVDPGLMPTILTIKPTPYHKDHAP